MNFDVCLIKTLWDTYETGIHNGEKNKNNLLVAYTVNLYDIQVLLMYRAVFPSQGSDRF